MLTTKRVEVVPFKVEHAKAMELVKVMKQTFFEPSPEYLDLLEQKGFSFSGIREDGFVMGIAGVEIMWPGVASCWTFLTDEARARPMLLHRKVKRYLENLILKHKLHRVEAECEVGFHAGQRWLEVLGFHREGMMLMRGIDKSDYFRYAKVRRYFEEAG